MAVASSAVEHANAVVSQTLSWPAQNEYCKRVNSPADLELHETYCQELSLIYLNLLPGDSLRNLTRVLGMCRNSLQQLRQTSVIRMGTSNVLYLYMLGNGAKSHQWVEVGHCQISPNTMQFYGRAGTWFYLVKGSGVSVNVGKTVVVDESTLGQTNQWSGQVMRMYSIISACLAVRSGHGPAPVQLDAATRAIFDWPIKDLCELDSIQITNHRDASGDKMFTEIVFLASYGEDKTLLTLIGEGAGKHGMNITCGRWPNFYPCETNIDLMQSLDCTAGVFSIFDHSSPPIISQSIVLQVEKCVSSRVREIVFGFFSEYPLVAASALYFLMSIVLSTMAHATRCREKEANRSVNSRPQKIRVALLVGLCNFMMGGSVYGYNSVLPLLYDAHFPLESCRDRPICTASSAMECCQAKRLIMPFLMSFAFLAHEIGLLCFVRVRDSNGPRTCLLVSASISIAGWVVYFFESPIPRPWAFVMLGAAAPGTFVACLSIIELLPSAGPLVISVSMASTDASSGIFQTMQTFSSHGSIPERQVVGGFIAVILIVTSCTLYMLPPLYRYKRISTAHTSAYELVSSNLSTVVFMCLFATANNFFLLTVSEQWNLLFSPPLADALSVMFNTAFPLRGVFFTPLFTALMHRSIEETRTFWRLLLISASVLAVCRTLPWWYAQAIAALLFGPIRAFGSWYHFYSVGRQVGPIPSRIYCATTCVVAIVGQFLSLALVNLVHGGAKPHGAPIAYGDEPSIRFVAVNMALAFAHIACMCSLLIVSS